MIVIYKTKHCLNPTSYLEAIKKSLGLICVSPFKKHKALTTVFYPPKTKQKAYGAVSEKFESVYGSTSSQASSSKSLIEWYKNSDSSPEHKTVLTIFASI